jgi:hypothetical protein
MVNIRRKGNTTYEGGKPQQTYLGVKPEPQRPRRNITDIVEPEAVEQMEMIDAPDQFIDTDNVNFIPIQSANGAIRATLY